MEKRRQIMSIFLVCFMLFASVLNVSAEEKEPIFLNTGNEVLEFETEADYENYLSIQDMWKTRSYNETKVTVVWTSRENYVFLAYHLNTPNWTTASSYNESYSSSHTLSGSYSKGGYSFSYSTTESKGMSISIPANSRYESKIGVWGDMNLTRSKYEVTNIQSGITTTYYVNTGTVLSKSRTAIYKNYGTNFFTNKARTDSR